MFATNRRKPVYARGKRRRLPLMLIGITVTVLIALIGVGIFVIRPLVSSHAAAAVNQNCTLTIPPNPLSAQGLATPYQLAATDPANGPCNEANPNQAAFVQAVILDPATGQMSAYEPLVIDQGTQPAVVPVAPQLPANAVVGIWFGDNGNALTLLQNHAKAVAQGNPNATANPQNAQPVTMAIRGGNMGRVACVNGTAGSVFGQFGYCNAVAFFQAANQAIAAGKITVPALGTGNDGLNCPSTRDFSIVDMDQSDNVQTQYLINANGQTAQLSAANQAQLPNATPLGNPSDNALVSKIIDPALGCQSFKIPDLVNPGTMTPTLATDELQAAAGQQAPIALVPALDDMVVNNGQISRAKINAYRVGVDQPRAATLNDANTTTYCQNIVNVALPRLNTDMATFQNLPSPDKGATATTLFGFLANRLSTTLSANGLNCVGSLKIQNPVTLTTDGNGIVTSATIAPKAVPANAGNGNGGNGGNGGVQQLATGGATINLVPNAGNAQVALNITYPNHPNQPINVNLAPNSCTGTPMFTQQENTDGNSQNQTNTVVNNLQGVQTIPNNWFFTVTDPAQNNAIVGCGAVVSNGTMATATLGTITPATVPQGQPAVTPTVPAGGQPTAPPTPAAGQPTATPTTPATGQPTATPTTTP